MKASHKRILGWILFAQLLPILGALAMMMEPLNVILKVYFGLLLFQIVAAALIGFMALINYLLDSK